MKLSFSTFALITVATRSSCWAQETPDLTVPTTEALDLTVDFDLNDDCSFEIIIVFKHDENLPVPTSPANCDPTNLVIAPDGLPYLAFREHYKLLSEEIRRQTPFDHLSIDFQSCGHPPVDVFTKPHYDVHIYFDPVEERVKRSCDLLPGAPVCEFRTEQPTDAGKAFFDPIPVNIAGFEVGVGDAIPYSGIHSWDFDTQPTSAAEWMEPIFITGGYGTSLAFWEPMIPLSFMTGDEARFYEESLVFETTSGEAPDPSIPVYYNVVYDDESGYVAMNIFGNEARECVLADGDDDDDGGKKKGKKKDKGKKKGSKKRDRVLKALRGHRGVKGRAFKHGV